jgi:hypothetical protein
MFPFVKFDWRTSAEWGSEASAIFTDGKISNAPCFVFENKNKHSKENPPKRKTIKKELKFALRQRLPNFSVRRHDELKMLTVKGFVSPLYPFACASSSYSPALCVPSTRSLFAKAGLFRITRSPTFPFKSCAWMSNHDCGEKMRS